MRTFLLWYLWARLEAQAYLAFHIDGQPLYRELRDQACAAKEKLTLHKAKEGMGIS